MCEAFGAEQAIGELVESYCGTCELGVFGTAVYRSSEYRRFQVWYLSNGTDFVFATHICPGEPDGEEVAEAQEILRRLTLVAKSMPRWRLW
jgi:hypothetical protein